jgi:predicted glycosyltransferase
VVGGPATVPAASMPAASVPAGVLAGVLAATVPAAGLPNATAIMAAPNAMRLHVDVCHPGHVHFFRHAMAALHAEGHVVQVTARPKDVTVPLLEALGIPHRVPTPLGGGRLGIWAEYPRRLRALAVLARQFRPDVITSISGIFVAPLGRLLGVPSLVFTDTEHAAIENVLTYPWATRVCTPYTFARNLGRVQERYQGLHELAYLHPARFRPDPGVRAELGLRPDERFAVVRFVSWKASHDRGHSGFGAELGREAVKRLAAHLTVLVSAEGPVPDGMDAHALRLPPHRVHHALAAASVYLGEGATMATESGLLGTPSVYVSTLVGTMGNFDVLGRAGLVEAFREVEPAIERAVALAADASAKPGWSDRARAFMDGHVDVAAYVHDKLLEVARRAA